MAYVIVGTCVNDTACIKSCPVDAIHPTPHEPGFAEADMLYIDPEACIDCNACAEACPVRAVLPAGELPTRLQRYREINALYARTRPR